MKDVPGDYYERLASVDDRHWWARGLVEIEGTLLAPWLDRGPRAILDAGCGTGAFLAWAARRVPGASLAGIDLSPDAISVARRRVPTAALHVGPLTALPFETASFDVITLNDVLQHVDEDRVAESLAELRRVLDPRGVLAVRTNGARRGRRERQDWRLYEPSSLQAHLQQGGFVVRRMTYANLFFSLVAELRGRGPRAPTGTTCGIPSQPGAFASMLGRAALGLETAVVGVNGRIPWGHTLLAVAVPR